jgi:anti-sigma B factor antagonist
MELQAEMIRDVVVVTLPVEELDASNAGELKRDIAALLDAHTHVVFDLVRLRFVDSSGLGSFLSCLRKLNAKGGDLKLCRVARPVRTVFELVRLQRVLDIYDTRDDAVAAFGR